MTLYSQGDISSLGAALMAKINELQKVQSDAFDGFHRSRTSTSTTQSYQYPSSVATSVSAADASNLGTSVTLARNLQGVMSYHFSDADAHLKADTVNVAFRGLSLANATLGEVMAFANQMKINYNAHLSQSGVHRKSDPNTVATANASDQTTANALLNALKAAANIHMNSAPVVGRLSVTLPSK